MFFVRKLLEPDPSPYSDNIKDLMPDRDGTETLDKIKKRMGNMDINNSHGETPDNSCRTVNCTTTDHKVSG